MYEQAFLYVASMLYFLYPIAFAALKRERRPVLIGVAAHGVNVAVFILCLAIYSPVHVWMLYVAPTMDDFGYLRYIDWMLSGIRSINEVSLLFLFMAGFITPYILCRRESLGRGERV
jgi:hypothetical protein